ncbi:MAG: phosphodiester glycosidase family protein [Bacteroidales bacterium]|nr:phosphodiester glycosidase family protein [Bacteroidales bacterium]
MLKRITLSLLLASCLFPTLLRAQIDYSVDSLRVVNAEWSIDTLEGFYLKRYQFSEGALFCSAQYLCVIEIPKKSHRRLAFACCDTALSELSTLAQRHNAYAAINGSFFDMDLGNPVCFLRINGQQFGENTPAKDDSVRRKYYQYATLLLDNGRPRVAVPDSNRLWEESLRDSNVMTAGPMLLLDGKEVPQRDDRTFVTRRHNRTAVGIRPDGTTLLLVADGRFRHQAEGLSLPELQRVMRWLGCTEAINLDGGGSTTMYIHDRPHDGVVNYPSDNHHHDHEGQRPVSNAILLL